MNPTGLIILIDTKYDSVSGWWLLHGWRHTGALTLVTGFMAAAVKIAAFAAMLAYTAVVPAGTPGMGALTIIVGTFAGLRAGQ